MTLAAPRRDRLPGLLRTVGLALCVAALAMFAILAFVVGVPQGPEGGFITGSIQTDVQRGLLALLAVGVLIAWRWQVVGAVIVMIAAAGIGVFAAFEYRPLAAFLPFLVLVVPGALLLAGSLLGRSLAWTAVAAVGLVGLFAGAGVAAQEVHDYAFGPTHPDSVAQQLPEGPVEWVWSGAVRPTAARVTAHVRDDEAPVRMVVSEDADLSSGRRAGRLISRGADGRVAAFEVTGLRPGTRYSYGVEVDGRLDRARIGRFSTPQQGPSSFTVAVGGCARRGSNAAVFDAIRAEQADLYLILGDMHYSDIDQPDPDLFREALDLALTRPGQQALYLSTPVAYVWDDHDYGPDGADSTSPTREAAQEVYREYVPHFALPGGEETGPINQAFTIGRARFVMLDLRSERVPADAPDGPAKTMMGAAQRRWLEGELLGARERGQLAVIVSSVPWIDPASPGADDWAGYATERRAISRFVAAHGIRAVMLGGDAHMIAIDDGSHADYSGTGRGGFPVMHAAALDRHGSAKGGPYSEGAFPGHGHYGTVTVHDDGERMRVELRGKDWHGNVITSLDVSVPAG